MKNEYPNLHERAMKFHPCFATTYLIETAFSAMTVLKTKQRKRLQISNCLRLVITSVHPRINKLTAKNSNKNLTCQTKSFKNSVVNKETTFNFFNNF